MRYDEAYDPNAPEGGSKNSSYVSRKDVRIVAVALVILSGLFYPVYRVLVRRSERSRCVLNLKGIMDSINQYAIQNDDKYPPIFDTGSNDEPALQSSGAPYTWASDLSDYMSRHASFICPTAETKEYTRSQDPGSAAKSFALTYGMFAPLSSFSRSLVENPNDAILIGETSNLGSQNSFDPLPFKNGNGDKMPYDAMVIGWDDDNFDGSTKSKYVTRLAFPNSSGPSFSSGGQTRHDEGTHMLTVSGHVETVKPNFARVQRRYGNIYGTWPMPLTAKRHP